MTKLFKLSILSTLLLAAPGFALAAEPAGADIVYSGGTIITMNDAAPTAEAVAIKDGKIIAVGTNNAVSKMKLPTTKVIDLKGKTLLPGFIDAHGNLGLVGIQLFSANLFPTADGKNASIEELQKTLMYQYNHSPVPRDFGIVLGYGYDDQQLKEHRHPTRDDLDTVVSQMPVAVVNESGHIGVLNTPALQIAGIKASTPNPEGGVIRRVGSSQEPNGVLEENALFNAIAKLTQNMAQAQLISILEVAQRQYMSQGFTTIQDGRATPLGMRTAQFAANQGRLYVDLVSYPDAFSPNIDAFFVPPFYNNVNTPPTYYKHLRIGGVKITLDGSVPGKTAWLDKPYAKPPEGQKADYAGYSLLADAALTQALEKALKNHCQVLTQASGDRAINQFITCMRAAGKKNSGASIRPVLVDALTIQENQLIELNSIHAMVAFCPLSVYYWGDWIRDSCLAGHRAQNIAPTGSAMQNKVMFTIQNDAPVLPLDPMRLLSSAVNRTTRSGAVLGTHQKIEPLVALKAMTIWAARQYFEEKTKGSLEVGKLADLVVLSDNPLTVAKEKISDIKVLETIKEGKSVYTRQGQ